MPQVITLYDWCSDVSEVCASSILTVTELGPGGCWSDELNSNERNAQTTLAYQSGHTC